MHRNISAFCVSLVLAATEACPQLSELVAASSAVVPIHSSGELGEYWAGATSFKVALGEAIRFVPYLGRSAPATHSLVWRTSTIRRSTGGSIESSSPRGRVATPTRFELRHAGCVETYDVRENGVEQSFVFASRPRGQGDLVITGAIESTLHADPRPACYGSIVFLDEKGDAVVEYGAAFAFDADGDRIRLTSAFDGETIQLRVPNVWLDEATYPVTIDPLLSRSTVDVGAPAEGVDCARDAVHGELMIAYLRAASALDIDAFARICDDDFSNSDIVFADLSVDHSTTSISVASTGLVPDYVLGVSRDEAAIGGGWRNGYHVHAGGDRSFGTAVTTIPQSTVGHDWRVVVGGTSHRDPGTSVVFAYQREPVAAALGQESPDSEVWVRTLDLAGGSLSAETRFDVLGPPTAADHERPAVNKVGDASTPWFVAWQRSVASIPGGADWAIFGRLVAGDGTVSAVPYGDEQPVPATHHRMAPRVEGRSGRFVMSWTQTAVDALPMRPSQPHGQSVFTRRIVWSNLNGFAIRYNPELLHGPELTRVWENGGIAFDDTALSHWSVAAIRQRDHGGDGSIHITRVGAKAVAVDSEVLHAGAPSDSSNSVAAVFDSDASEVVCAFAVGALGEVAGNRYAYTPAGPITHFGTGCSPSATIDWVDNTIIAPGSQQIGSDQTHVRLANASVSHAWALLIVGAAPTDLDLSGLGLPGCHLYVPIGGAGHIGILQNNTALGFRNMAFPIPEGLPAFTLHLQWLYQVTPGSFDWGTTDRIEVPLVW